MEKKYYDPISNEELVWEKGYLKNPNDNTWYILNNEEVKPLVHNNMPMVPIDNNLFLSSNNQEQILYRFSKNNTLKPFMDPYCHCPLIRVDNNIFQSVYSGKNFYYDINRDITIPLYIPDKTLEPAHLEGDTLVSNLTGRRFNIDDNGIVLTPSVINERKINEEALASLNKLVSDTKINSPYKPFLDRLEKIMQERENNPLFIKFIANGDTVYYQLQINHNQNRETLDSGNFQNDSSFEQDMLEVAVSTYASYNPYMTSESNMRLDGSNLIDYRSFSVNDACLDLNGFKKVEIDKVSTIVKNTEAINFVAATEENLALNNNNDMTLRLAKEDSNKGFLNTVELVILVIITIIAGIILAIYLLTKTGVIR